MNFNRVTFLKEQGWATDNRKWWVSVKERNDMSNKGLTIEEATKLEFKKAKHANTLLNLLFG